MHKTLDIKSCQSPAPSLPASSLQLPCRAVPRPVLPLVGMDIAILCPKNANARKQSHSQYPKQK